ncbi:hypothetical protein M5D96_009355 [Drosophila gunungcola]|uniref:Phosducin domain-containing protein n=1 Tax=Drosophila gunungcola TaxID=103775 RepID=A0A9P9YIZ1_9MUSC|nr:hypothetical protein M5D96_009355 [Drosophila gunungcola]
MATLEDKLLGEKLEYYCSSSEGEDNGDEGDDSKGASGKSRSSGLTIDTNPDATPAGGFRQQGSTNTGPKGVVKDWQRFKQLEAERRDETERQRLALAKKLTITTATAAEDEERKRQEELDAELDELMSEDFLQQYQKQRMAEMLRQTGHHQQFGQVQQLSTHGEFLACVEQENKHTTIIIHIYERQLAACTTLNKCLDSLASDYPSIKFAKICSSAQAVIGNFVRLTDDLSDDFFASDVESFLIEHGILVDRALYN